MDLELEIEKNVIWNMISHNEQVPAVLEILTEKDFYDPLYKNAFITIEKLHKEKRIVDLPLLYLEMGKVEISRVIGEHDDLYGALHHAQILRQRNVENDIGMAQRERNYEIVQEKIKELKSIGSPVELSRITEIIEKGEKRNEMIPTGYRHFDQIVSFECSDLMVLAGYTSVGKSILACTMMANMAQDYNVGIISFEMSEFKIVKRLSYAFDLNYLNSINQSFLISSPAPFTISKVRKTIQDMIGQKNIKVVLIDYLQLMSELRHYSSRHLEISFIIRSLKEMAKEFNVAMIVVSSLARKDRSDNSEPVLSDLKESGDIEYAADIVCFLHRKKDELDADLKVSKNRNGKSGTIRLDWDSQKIRYNTHFWQE